MACVLVLSLTAVVVLLAAVLVAVGAVATTRHRAASAADLGALAAAGRTLQGPSAACAVAARVVQAADASLVSCRVSGPVVDLAVVVRPAGVLGRWGEARSRARAGPADPLTQTP